MKRLYRSRTDKQVAGVLGGISEYLEIDSTVVRLVYLLITVFTGFVPGILFYIIAALVMPQRPAGEPPV